MKGEHVEFLSNYFFNEVCPLSSGNNVCFFECVFSLLPQCWHSQNTCLFLNRYKKIKMSEPDHGTFFTTHRISDVGMCVIVFKSNCFITI